MVTPTGDTTSFYKIAKATRILDGVSDVKMGILKELIVVQDWLEAEIGKHLSER